MPQPIPLRRRRILAAVLVALLLAAGGFLLWRSRDLPPASPTDASRATPSAASTLPPSPAYSPLADELHAPSHDAVHDLVVLRGLLAQLTTTFRLDQRPSLGDNADITAALTGRNRQRIAFVPPDHPAIRDGTLIDRWGTPFHFHARSAELFDLRSAGPDRTLFTADDLLLTP